MIQKYKHFYTRHKAALKNSTSNWLGEVLHSISAHLNVLNIWDALVVDMVQGFILLDLRTKEQLNNNTTGYKMHYTSGRRPNLPESVLTLIPDIHYVFIVSLYQMKLWWLEMQIFRVTAVNSCFSLMQQCKSNFSKSHISKFSKWVLNIMLSARPSTSYEA